MKGLLFTLLLIPFLGFGQLQPQKVSNFVLENKEVKYINVFQVDTLNSEKIRAVLSAYLPTVSGLTNIQFNGDIITGEIKNLRVDARKYGGSNATSWMPVGFPMDGKFLVEIKGGRYRVVLTDLYCHVLNFPNTLTAYSTRKQQTQFATANIVLQGLEFMNKDFTSRFQIKETAIKSDW